MPLDFIPEIAIRIEPETLRIAELVKAQNPEDLDTINYVINREIRKVLLQMYGECLDHRSEYDLRERIKQRYDSR
jgi:hypothetical protein